MTSKAMIKFQSKFQFQILLVLRDSSKSDQN